MADHPVYFARQRHLRAALRGARALAGLSERQAAERLGWTVGKLARIERGIDRATPGEIALVQQNYGDPDRTRELTGIAELERLPQWWDGYTGSVAASLLDIVEWESVAGRVWQFQSSVVPGLLQTREYARAVIGMHDGGSDAFDDYLDLRTRRQQVFSGSRQQEFEFVVDESALRRPVGGVDTLRAQWARLRELDALPRVSVKVVPFGAGGHRAMHTSFTVFQLSELSDYEAVQMTAAEDSVLRDDAEEGLRYMSLFREVAALATPLAEVADPFSE